MNFITISPVYRLDSKAAAPISLRCSVQCAVCSVQCAVLDLVSMSSQASPDQVRLVLLLCGGGDSILLVGNTHRDTIIKQGVLFSISMLPKIIILVLCKVCLISY